MKTHLLFISFTLLLLISCNTQTSSKKSNSTNSSRTTGNSEQGVWILTKGGNNKNEYSFINRNDSIFLETKIYMDGSDPILFEEELIKKDGQYIKKNDNIDSPSYSYEINGDKLVIHDQFGVYAELQKTRKK